MQLQSEMQVLFCLFVCFALVSFLVKDSECR